MASAQLRLQPGALVVGGDYQGLGIVRSLGRRGIPVCVVDDEWSIARFSRYATHMETVADLRDECNAVDAVLAIARRGWRIHRVVGDVCDHGGPGEGRNHPSGNRTAGGAYVPAVFVGMYAPLGRYNVRVLKHYYGLNHLHYLTTRPYRRARRFDS